MKALMFAVLTILYVAQSSHAWPTEIPAPSPSIISADPHASSTIEEDAVYRLVSVTLRFASAPGPSVQIVRTIAVYYDGDRRCKDEAAALNRKSGTTAYACVRGLH